jgi:lipopolysaccharide biosynthesis glycosyltransferase
MTGTNRMKDPDTAIVTVSDRRFLPAACCQLVSTAGHLVGVSGVQLFMVVCDVTDDDIADVKNFFSKRALSVEVVVPDFVDQISILETRWPRAAYLRLYFDLVFDDRWRRIVYFDADTRICSPLAPLLEVDLRGQPIAAVHDFIYYVTGNIHRRRRDLFLADDAPYFQSGVMVFDWKEMLARGGLAEARRFLAEHPEACYEAPDQDALNATFENRWTPLDPRWNLHETYLMFGAKLQPKLTHFTSTKPWSRRRTRAWREAATWYRTELADSPWRDFVESQSLWDGLRADLGFLRRRYYPHLHEALSEILPPFLFRKLPHSRHLPWVPRRTQDVEEMATALVMEAEGSCPPLRPPESVLTRGHWRIEA